MGWQNYLIEDDEEIRQILYSIRKIAVIGIKDKARENEAAHSVPKYLHEKGYEIYPVNPRLNQVFGRPCYDSILNIPDPVDAVLVFRKPGNVLKHAEEALSLDPKPSVFWMQTGIRNMAAARKLASANIKVVQDHCMYRDHLRLIRSQ